MSLYYDQIVVSIIQNIVSHNKTFPQFECVLRQFLFQFGVSSLQQLGFTQLPSLDLLYDVQQKVNAFISAYVGTQSVVSYVDLEVELCVMLKSFDIPNFTVWDTSIDPNEVDTNTDEVVEKMCFESFGLGPLHRHPYIQKLFPMVGNTSVQKASTRLSTADIMERLEEFMSPPSENSSFIDDNSREGDVARIDIPSFHEYLCHHYKVISLDKLGVIIKGTLKGELLMIRHVIAHRRKLHLQMQRQYIENMVAEYNGNDYSTVNVAEKVPKHHRGTTPSAHSGKVAIHPSNNNQTISLMNRFEEKLDSPHSPTFQKTCMILEQMWIDEKSNMTDIPNTRPAMKKRKREKNHRVWCENAASHLAVNGTKNELTVFEREILNSSAEYLMLQLGGSKYRNKRLFIDNSEYNEMSPQLACVGAHCNNCVVNLKGSENESDVSSSSSQADSSSGSDDSESESSVPSQKKYPPTSQSNHGDYGIVKGMNCENNSKASSLASLPFEGKIMHNIQVGVECIDVAALMPSLLRRNTILSEALSSKADQLRAIGRWGECLVYQYLLLNHPQNSVTWLNEIDESNASYDIKLEHNKSASASLRNTIFIEVKTTQFSDKNVFQISKHEWDFMASLPRIQYDIYRVYSAGNSSSARIVIYHDVYKLIDEGKIQLCLAV